MAILCLACIVEGDGEVPAVPVLLRRLVPFIEPQVYPEVPRPIDSDGDCPKELAPALLARAEGAAGGRYPIGVVLPKCEFESWFIAAAESVAGYRGLKDGLIAPPNPESIRDAKGWLEKQMPPGGKYSEPVDQPALAGIFDLTARGKHRPSTNYVERWSVSVPMRWRLRSPDRRDSVTLQRVIFGH
jgi:hypothetical protein